MSADKLRDLHMDEARAIGELVGMARTMLIYHDNGGEKPEHWARLKEAYDAYQACNRALIDAMCEAMDIETEWERMQ